MLFASLPNLAHHRPRVSVGPPGTSKISLSQSIDCALGRPYQRIPSGGTRDEAEIRGHRSTDVVSGPRLIVQALLRASCIGPAILPDETKLDKVIFIEILLLPF